MTDKTRITIAALTTMLVLAAMSVAGALTHTGTPVAATSQAPSVAISAPHAVPPQTTDQIHND
jgi:hypothetical protein